MSPDLSTDDPTQRAWRSRKAATNLGIAVHAVLEWLDLESLSNMEQLAAWSAAENKVEPVEVAHLARLAALSDSVRRAVTSGRNWRKVLISVSIEGALLEGAIDLLYEDIDGSFVVVDYKTDHVSPAALSTRAQDCRLQGEAYALALRRGPGLQVNRIEFVFAGSERDRVDVFVMDVHDLRQMRAAIASAGA